MRALALLLLASACSRPFGFEHALHEEEARRYPRAAAAYLRFAEARPKDPRAPEALARAAGIYAGVFGRCDRAVPLYERAAREASGDWAERARLGLLSCPDYLPARPGASWTYVDSQSGGRNMRLEARVVSSSGAVAGDYYAGAKKVQAYRRSYAREGWTIWEESSGERLPALKYPFSAGRSWVHRAGGKETAFLIEAEGIAVRVKAGDFSGCLKVSRRLAGYPSWVYDYYCPGVGRVKTTIGVPGAENPNTELSSYAVPAAPY